MAVSNAGSTTPPRASWQRPFHVMAKPVGAVCNLACSYCFYRERAGDADAQPAGLRLAAPISRRMRSVTLETFVKDYLAAQPAEEVSFAWQGGEPTCLPATVTVQSTVSLRPTPASLA